VSEPDRTNGAVGVDLSTEGVVRMYRAFGADLARVRAWEEKLFHNRAYSAIERDLRRTFPVLEGIYPAWYLYRGLLRAAFPQRRYIYPFFGDFDCEILYLLVRALRPKVLVEVSPSGGWSTSWILNALRDNGAGTLYSCDLIDDSARNLPRELTDGRWKFLQGDVFRTVENLPSQIEFLFVDALHTAEFARWYVQHLFPRLTSDAVVGVDDMFHQQGGMFVSVLGAKGGETEPDVMMSWLRERNQSYYTVAEPLARSDAEAVRAVRRELNLSPPLRRIGGNPAIFFQLGKPSPYRPT
jgi:hypothetical protein